MKKELTYAILAGVFWIGGIIAPNDYIDIPFKNIFYFISILFGGYFTIQEAFSDLKKKLKPSNFSAYFAYVDSSDNNRIVGFKVCVCDTAQQNQLRRHLIKLEVPRLLLFIRYKKNTIIFHRSLQK